jgi:hypothetical protein
MSFSILKYAKGLPSLLSLKERGQGPGEFSQTVVGTIDLSDLYLVDSRESQFSATMNTAVGGVNFFTPDLVVPPGELWYIYHYFVIATTAGADSAEFVATINLDAQLISCPVSDYVVLTINQTKRTTNFTPLLAGPGSRFGFNVQSIAGAPVFQGGVMATRLRV